MLCLELLPGVELNTSGDDRPRHWQCYYILLLLQLRFQYRTCLLHVFGLDDNSGVI